MRLWSTREGNGQSFRSVDFCFDSVRSINLKGSTIRAESVNCFWTAQFEGYVPKLWLFHLLRPKERSFATYWLASILATIETVRGNGRTCQKIGGGPSMRAKIRVMPGVIQIQYPDPLGNRVTERRGAVFEGLESKTVLPVSLDVNLPPHVGSAAKNRTRYGVVLIGNI